MMSEGAATISKSVNQHYLDKVMDLAEERDVAATEDIFNATGTKLIAKGTKISRSVQEKLILHKLHRPLESCIAVAGGIDMQAITAEARRIAQEIEPVGHLLNAVGGAGPSPFDIQADAQFGSAMSMMLTITQRGGPAAFTHCVLVSLVSICLARKLGLDQKQQISVALAGLLHDIGELYILPEYLDPKRRLLPHEWKHVVVHPRVGQMLISELENCPPEVALAVAEHHERFDGAGYPRQTAGQGISVLGQILATAEMVSGAFMKQHKPLERAELAMKIMPGEHAHDLVSIISSVARVTRSGSPPPSEAPYDEMHQRLKILFDRIIGILHTAQTLVDMQTIRSTKAKDLVSWVLERVNIIQRAFSSTGLDVCLLEDAIHDIGISFEVEAAAIEIQVRLREVARDLFLRASAFASHEMQAFQPLIVLLDEAG
jgi:HD-GYP domain-containing protein (c-di-GMP phosphodiesterase class II)